MRTVEHAEPFLEELAQPADEAGERVGRKQYGGKLGNADLLPSLPNGDGGGASVVAKGLQQECVGTIEARRAGNRLGRCYGRGSASLRALDYVGGHGRLRSVALEDVPSK